MKMELTTLLKGIEYGSERAIDDVCVRRINANAGSVKKGDLFIAKNGTRYDGHEFIREAVRRGARVIVSERDAELPEKGAVNVIVRDMRHALPALAANFYGDPSRCLRTVGVTGTNGKTTVTYLIEGILKADGRQSGVIGTINYRMGNDVTASKNTTPGPIELQAILRRMADAHLGYAVMEVSSHALDQNRIGGLGFAAVIFTNVTREHLDYHKTLSRYLKAKERIFDYLREDGAAVLNADDPRVVALRPRGRGRVITFGMRRRADVKAREVSLSLDGSDFTVRTNHTGFRVHTPLLGLHNVSNILAAAGFGIAEGINLDSIRAGIERVGSVPGRMEAVKTNAPFHIFVDYAHTDDALHKVLVLLRGVVRRRIITVFGCGGDRDRSKRPRMGRVACGLSDTVVITSDNPRSERPRDIIADIVRGVGRKYSNYSIEEDRAEAIRKALGMAGRGDVVIIAGKGHETYQIIGDRTLPFDDREVVRGCLK